MWVRGRSRVQPTEHQSCELKRKIKVIKQEILDLSKRDEVDAA